MDMVRRLEYIDQVQYDSTRKRFNFHFSVLDDLKHNLENYIRVVFISCWNGRIYDDYEGHCLRDAIIEDKLFYNKNNGKFFYIETDNVTLFQNIFKNTKNISNIYSFIPYVYNSSDQSYNFRQICKNKLKTNRSKFNYSFGIEFETSSGIIPEYKCFQLGLIPLRDGSIGGFEYATIPMTIANLDLLKMQLQTLKQYTTFGSDCSMHIHFGNYPQDAKYLYILYKVFYSIQDQIAEIMPKFTFHTELYKENGKSYCKLLENFPSFESWYEYLHCGPITSNSYDVLTKPHPCDPSGTSKWRIPTRYEAVNFINALYFNNAKTIEFRFLKPSYNLNYIINWICVFTFILQHAEEIYNDCKDKSMSVLNNITTNFCDIFTNPNYSITITCKLLQFLNDLKELTAFQASLNDHIGLFSWCHDNFFKTNIVNYE